MVETSHHFEYISPAILRGADLDDFLLFYHEADKKIGFSGRLPNSEWPGSLDFYPESTWQMSMPNWAKNKRSIIEARLLEFTAQNTEFNWIIAERFGACPRPCPSPSPSPSPFSYRCQARQTSDNFISARNEPATTPRRKALRRDRIVMAIRIVFAVSILFAAVTGVFRKK